MDDATLLQRYVAEGDGQAFTALVRRHVHMVHAAALRMVPGEAEDITQTVFCLLHQKAHRLMGHPNLGGWLYQTTRYSAIAARRLQAARIQRESGASAMSVQRAPDPAELIALRDLLDSGLEKLAAKDREAVILRYLEDRSLQETAGLLKVSVEAARKRATRGLEKLRVYFQAKGQAASLASVTALLSAEAEHRASEAVLNMAAAGGSTSLAKATAALMGKAKLRFATGVMGVILAAAGLGVIVSAQPDRPLPPLAAPVRSALPVAEDEALLPGPTRLYGYSLLVEHGLWEAVVKECNAIPTEGGVFQAYLMPSESVRGWLGPRVLTRSRNSDPDARVYYSWHSGPNLGTVEDKPVEQGNSFSNFYSPGGLIMIDGRTGWMQVMLRGVIRGIVWEDAAGVHFPWRGNDWRFEISGLPGGKLEKGGEVGLEAVARPGETLMIATPAGTIRGREWVCVNACEIFRATDRQAGPIGGLRNSDQWLAYGPSAVRKLADQMAEWNGKGHPGEQAPEKWVRKLGDGTTVQLEGAYRPDKWPGITWDGEGKPVREPMPRWDGDPGYVHFVGHITSSTPPKNMNGSGRTWGMPGTFNQPKPAWWSDRLKVGQPARTTIRVPVGAFRNAGRVEWGKPVQIEGFVCTVREVERDSKQWRVRLRVEGGTAEDHRGIAIVPVIKTRTGQEVGPESSLYERSEMGYWRDQPQSGDGLRNRPYIHEETLEYLRRSGSDFDQTEFDHVEVCWRKVEFVTFGGFATAPTDALPADLETLAVGLAKVDGKAAEDRAAGVPMKTAVPSKADAEAERGRDLLESILEQAAAGDPKLVRPMLVGSEQACVTMAEVIVLRTQLELAVMARLNSMPGGMEDMLGFREEFLADTLNLRDGGILYGQQHVLRKSPEGVWHLDADASGGGEFREAKMRNMMELYGPKARALIDELNRGTIQSESQLRERLQAITRDLAKREEAGEL